jgi:hypothetical protein
MKKSVGALPGEIKLTLRNVSRRPPVPAIDFYTIVHIGCAKILILGAAPPKACTTENQNFDSMFSARAQKCALKPCLSSGAMTASLKSSTNDFVIRYFVSAVAGSWFG